MTVTAIQRDRHLLFVLHEAQKAFELGDFQAGLSNITHAVFVAATDGRGGLSDHDLICELRKITGWGYNGEAA